MVYIAKEPEDATPADYVAANLTPTLTKGLAELCLARPKDPVTCSPSGCSSTRLESPVLPQGSIDNPRVLDVFKQFDFDNDGALTMGELKRAFRAVGMSKRTGFKAELDANTFRAMDKNGDGDRYLRMVEWPAAGPARTASGET